MSPARRYTRTSSRSFFFISRLMRSASARDEARESIGESDRRLKSKRPRNLVSVLTVARARPSDLFGETRAEPRPLRGNSICRDGLALSRTFPIPPLPCRPLLRPAAASRLPPLAGPSLDLLFPVRLLAHKSIAMHNARCRATPAEYIPTASYRSFFIIQRTATRDSKRFFYSV